MDIRTFRAATLYEALQRVRSELGPDAAVLQTREVPAGGLLNWLRGAKQIEVTASSEVNVPSRLPKRNVAPPASATAITPPVSAARNVAQPSPAAWNGALLSAQDEPARMPLAPPAATGDDVQNKLNNLSMMVNELCRQSRRGQQELPDTLFRLFTDLIEADLDEDVARELVERIRGEVSGVELADPVLLKARLARSVENEVATLGPLPITPGRRRLVALVGPTGVGKTTTIAKLAANYRLKQKRNVGLITVDTYRIAAVEQLRTYADIIDLPMQVVSTPKEMREAVRRMASLDLVLLDTAGRSPKDGIRIQELKALLTEAAADEVYLVLTAVAAGRTLQQTAERFAAVGTTGLILTKLDEATGLGNVLPLLRSSRLPLAYVTNGQNVPDDIEVADSGRIARMILGLETVAAA